MSKLSIVAHIRAKTDQAERVGAALDKLVTPSRNDPGCEQYDFFVDTKDPAHFVLYEIWESSGAQQAHLDEPHVAAFVLACKGAIAEATIYELDKRR